jgi:hypothetical protein
MRGLLGCSGVLAPERDRAPELVGIDAEPGEQRGEVEGDPPPLRIPPQLDDDAGDHPLRLSPSRGTRARAEWRRRSSEIE